MGNDITQRLPEMPVLQIGESPLRRIAELEERHLDDLMIMAEIYERTLMLEDQNLMLMEVAAMLYEAMLTGDPP